MNERQSEDHGQTRDCLCRCFFCVEAWRELFRMVRYSSELLLKELTMQIWFYGLFYFEILSLLWICRICTYYQHIQLCVFVFFISVWNHHILCFNFCGLFLLVQKCHRKSHLITTAMLPLHGFLIVSLAKTQACLHW